MEKIIRKWIDKVDNNSRNNKNNSYLNFTLGYLNRISGPITNLALGVVSLVGITKCIKNMAQGNNIYESTNNKNRNNNGRK